MVKTKIILQPKKEILDSYFRTNTANYIFNEGAKLYPSEALALGAIAEAYRPNTIIRIPEVSYPLETKTPDFLIDDVEYEVKAPIAYSGISSLAKKSKTQLRFPTGYLVMDLMNIKNIPLYTLFKRAYNFFLTHHIKNFIIMCHGNILYSTHA